MHIWTKVKALHKLLVDNPQEYVHNGSCFFAFLIIVAEPGGEVNPRGAGRKKQEPHNPRMQAKLPRVSRPKRKCVNSYF